MKTKTIDQIYITVGKRIISARSENNMSQERLANVSGIDRSHVGFIEQGRRKPTLSTLYKLTAALGISLEELFQGL